jgi:AraC-like DNA-binding protein
MKSSQSTIEEAVAFLCAQKDANLDVSVRSVAWQFGISHATLERRLEGGLTNPLAQESRQKLTAAQEKWLVNWVIEEARQKLHPTYDRVRQMAQLISNSNGITETIDKRWIDAFKSRNPQV